MNGTKKELRTFEMRKKVDRFELQIIRITYGRQGGEFKCSLSVIDARQ